MITKSKSKPKEGYAGVFNYRSTFANQRVHVKYEDDVKAIDILLSNGLERQARIVLDVETNFFQTIKP